MANSFLPQDIILCILSRLPVKSLIRFKSVCKAWCKLFAMPEFIKMHLDQFSSDPKNQSFIIHHRVDVDQTQISLLSSIESSGEKKPTILGQPYPGNFRRADILGCCNGLVCMGNPLNGFVLWNPALKVAKFVPFSSPGFEDCNRYPRWWVSLGFGYDAEEADFKVVAIYCSKKKIGIYSANSGFWKTIKLDFEFNFSSYTTAVIVNGNPYWMAKVEGNIPVLVLFDVRKLDFKIVPLSALNLQEENWIRQDVLFVDWEGRLGALVHFFWERRIESWVFSDGEEVIWRKNHEFRPIDHMEVSSILECWSGGKIIVWEYNYTGKLSLVDPEKGCVEEIVIDQTFSPHANYGIYHHTESLAYVKGMNNNCFTLPPPRSQSPLQVSQFDLPKQVSHL